MFNILSFDVEEWFHSHFLTREDGDLFKSRVDAGARRIIEILRENKIKCTFFVLGKIAEVNPDIVEMIDAENHEIATHGYSHRPLLMLTPEEFKKDLLLSMQILKGITGKDVLGYRAPGYSITRDTLWALDIIKDCGLRYDSSIYPVSLRLFTKGGISGYSQKQFFIEDRLVEFPLSTLNLLGLQFPVATTSYFRLFPYRITKWAIERLNDKNIAATLNFHTWEFDENQPRIKLPFFQGIKHYYNLSQTENRFKRLINEFNFISCKKWLEGFSLI